MDKSNTSGPESTPSLVCPMSQHSSSHEASLHCPHRNTRLELEDQVFHVLVDHLLTIEAELVAVKRLVEEMLP
jgi:hypothetical protein